MTRIKKSKIIIYTSSYPFGKTETFLHNEIQYLSRYYDIDLFPVMKQKGSDEARPLPSNVTFNKPFLATNYFKRIVRGLFNLSPILPYFIDLLLLIRSSKNIKASLKEWFIHLLVFRTMYSCSRFKKVIRSAENVKYFYWGNFPLGLVKNITGEIFMRIHGGEVDNVRHFGHIPMVKKKIINDKGITYLPISKSSIKSILAINEVQYELNRLGVYDHGINVYPVYSEEIRIVSCSNLIRLKRVHLIIQALNEIQDVKVTWVHFGDGPLFEELQLQSQALSENITCEFKGRVENSVVLDYFKSVPIDLFVNVSQSEGLPVSIMEAFSFGIPCFATDVGGTSEIVNNRNGYLAEKNFEIKELANFIRTIRVDNCTARRRQVARETWEHDFNAEINYQCLNQILNRIT